MEILSLHAERGFTQIDTIESQPATGYVWLDYERENGAPWAADIERMTGIKLHERHIQDSLSVTHPSFYDSTSNYEMLIFSSLAPELAEEYFPSRPTTFFLFKHLMVTIRSSDSRSIAAI